MSWSVSACGPASQIAEQLEQQFSKIRCHEPEQQVVEVARKLVATALSTTDPDKPLRISGSGSLGFKKWGSGLDHATDPHVGPFHSFDLKIEPIHFTVG
jgi:hypothetical protein